MGPQPERAYRLQEKAEQWQTLAARQQELAMHLRALARVQRELTRSWGLSDAEDLTVEARQIEDGLRALSAQVLHLEGAALERMSDAIAEEARLLRPE